MSFWWYKKDKEGKGNWLAVDVPITIIMMFVLLGLVSLLSYCHR